MTNQGRPYVMIGGKKMYFASPQGTLAGWSSGDNEIDCFHPDYDKLLARAQYDSVPQKRTIDDTVSKTPPTPIGTRGYVNVFYKKKPF